MVISRLLKKSHMVIFFSVCILIGIFFFTKCIVATTEQYPREYRDVVNIQMTDMFAQGANPYRISEDSYQYVNVYGPLNPLIASAFVRLLDLSSMNALYVLYFLCMVATALLIAFRVSKNIGGGGGREEKGIWLIGVFLCALLLSYRLGYISTIPDSLGIFVGVLVLILAERKRNFKNLLLVAVVTVLGFYVKAYFLFFCLPVFIYYLVEDRKSAGVYFISTAVVGLGSLWIISSHCPMYLFDNIYFELAEQSNIEVKKGAAWLVNQTVHIIAYFAPLFLTIGIWGISKIKRVRKLLPERFKNLDFDNKKIKIYLIVALCALLVLLKLGQNTGAWISYYLQLMMPSVLIIAFSVAWEFGEKFSERKRKLYVHSFVIATLICSWYFLGKVDLRTDEQNVEWEKAYAVIDEYYTLGCEMYLSPVLGDYARQLDIPIYDNGHDYMRLILERDSNVEETIVQYEKLFPALAELYSKAYAQQQNIISKIQNGTYTLIATDSAMSREYCKYIEEYYEELMIKKLYLGTQDVEIIFWVPKKYKTELKEVVFAFTL